MASKPVRLVETRKLLMFVQSKSSESLCFKYNVRGLFQAGQAQNAAKNFAPRIARECASPNKYNILFYPIHHGLSIT